ncbi:hypothetical protein [Paenibacillus rhizophilus]|uniref:Uncharacterized protein n=1 Tax=Paenibacillus rhizophilus TaxID=1850366 RepID=A0A3N9P2E1_9BACL|nr:hypothetical protein [Paenibacillus rhizophilus]RQW09909.1 hypothetical protein EH198_17665 [Paenibacillus rhizophilus]
MFPENGWQEQEEYPDRCGTAVNWEELTVRRREEEIVPGTDNLDADRTIGGLTEDNPDDLDDRDEKIRMS